MEKELKGQVAIVTGGNSGIGRAIAIDLAEKGAKVFVLSRNELKNEEVKNEILKNGGLSETYGVDVSDELAVSTAINEITSKEGRVDILICCAGNSTNPSYAHKISKEDFDSVIQTHIYGTMNAVKACIPKMKEKKYGRIVLMSSTGGYHGMAGNASYSIAKHGLVGLTYTLAKELGPHGITVNALQPGLIRTPICEDIVDAFSEKFISETPVRRVGKPEDIAYATSFFCSPKADFATGMILRIDGGYLIEAGMDRLMLSFLK